MPIAISSPPVDCPYAGEARAVFTTVSGVTLYTLQRSTLWTITIFLLI